MKLFFSRTQQISLLGRLGVLFLGVLFLLSFESNAQESGQKFEQLGTMLPTPNEYRTAGGSPGKSYWTQQADYDINITLDAKKQNISGSETITYHNNSPESLNYLWLQLDQNIRKPDSDRNQTKTGALSQNRLSSLSAQKSLVTRNFDGGFKIQKVADESDKDLPYTINKTMMRVEIPKPLKPEETISIKLEWSYNLNDRLMLGGRSGYEYFPKDKNYIFTIAQFYPRMCAYTDVEGWQNKQFLGDGEFALTFGNYSVNINLPDDYVVAATGTIQNVKEALTSAQQSRLEKAKKNFDKPTFIVTAKEAKKNERATPSKVNKSWVFKAYNVRDFAFAASRKFIWDAEAVKIEGSDNTPLAMSFYPNEGNPLWERESTKAVKNTLQTYSKYTFPYPYPVAISVHTASIGMEYPMICFNWGRPKPDGSYSDRVKFRMLGVIIHEVGHNFFPMLVNSDERQWGWMDEGINTFLQFRTEQERYKNFPSRRGPANTITYYMKGEKKNMRPIMTNPDQVLQLGNNAYGKPAAALNLLRETVMGPKLFDYAFKSYANKWIYKSPEPADFFRTMEDASAVDLDWFWRGWFFSTDYVDVDVKNVRLLKVADFSEKTNIEEKDLPNPFEQNSNEIETINMQITDTPENYYGEFQNKVDDDAVKREMSGALIYEVALENKGGLATPVLLNWEYEDGTKELQQLPAEVWRKNDKRIVKTFIKSKKVKKVTFDPQHVTADVDESNNSFPKENKPGDFDKFLQK